MINWLYLHLRAIGHALGRLAGQPLGTLLSALVVGIALSLPGGGYLLLEHGWQQGQAVRDVFTRAGYQAVETCRDYGGNERITLGCIPS